MFEDNFVNSLGLFPSKEDINNIRKKLDNNEQLTFYDYIIIEKVRIIYLILNSKGVRI